MQRKVLQAYLCPEMEAGRTFVLASEKTASRPMLMQAATCGRALCGAKTIACTATSNEQCVKYTVF